MRLLYSPIPNLVARTALRPFSFLLPPRYRFPVVGKIRVQPSGGTPFVLACNPTSYICKVIFWGSPTAFEPEIAPVFRHLARTARTFVDVGANIGYYSLLASAYNPHIEVVAFEPSPDPFSYLRRNCLINGRSNITAEQIALSDRPGRIAFYPAWNPKYPDMAQLGGMGSVGLSQGAGQEEGKRTEVKAETLDGYLRRRFVEQIKVDLVKIDVEGAELSVFKGAANVLSGDRPIILFETLPRVGNRSVIMDLLASQNYATYLATDSGLIDVESTGGVPGRWTNYVAAPLEERSRLAPFVGER